MLKISAPRKQDLGSRLLTPYSWVFNSPSTLPLRGGKGKSKAPKGLLNKSCLLTWQPEPRVGELGSAHNWFPLLGEYWVSSGEMLLDPNLMGVAS